MFRGVRLQEAASRGDAEYAGELTTNIFGKAMLVSYGTPGSARMPQLSASEGRPSARNLRASSSLSALGGPKSYRGGQASERTRLAQVSESRVVQLQTPQKKAAVLVEDPEPSLVQAEAEVMPREQLQTPQKKVAVLVEDPEPSLVHVEAVMPSPAEGLSKARARRATIKQLAAELDDIISAVEEPYAVADVKGITAHAHTGTLGAVATPENAGKIRETIKARKLARCSVMGSLETFGAGGGDPQSARRQGLPGRKAGIEALLAKEAGGGELPPVFAFAARAAGPDASSWVSVKQSPPRGERAAVAMQASVRGKQVRQQLRGGALEWGNTLSPVQTFVDTDVYGSGTISLQQLRVALRGKSGMSDQVIADLFAACDLSGDGFISLQEFLKGTRKTVAAQAAAVAEGTMTLIEAFVLTDVDGSGSISLHELRVALRGKSSMSDQAIDELFAACDLSGDGQMSLLEFLKGSKKLNSRAMGANTSRNDPALEC